MNGFMTPGDMAMQQAFQPMQYQQPYERAFGELNNFGVNTGYLPRINGSGLIGDRLPILEPRFDPIMPSARLPLIGIDEIESPLARRMNFDRFG